MRGILIAAILLASPLAAHGATKIDITIRLPNYDLKEQNGEISGTIIHGVVASGSETLLDKYSKKLVYNSKQRIAYLGARFFFYAREQEDKVYFLVRIELCKQDSFTTEITKSTTNLRGERAWGEMFIIKARAPGNSQTDIEIWLSKK
ncbi:MAG: hypothetical protein DMF06_07770 [Verrucomicrobia bacterium]|nr:MAG: hypothetical protein DMF06_07770 [Verrucomicrobiota bacterium]